MEGIWTPDLSQIGVNPATLPEGWGWTTLNKHEEVTFGTPLARNPHYGEFTVAEYVTAPDACHHVFGSTRLILANVCDGRREDWGRFFHGWQWRKSLTPWAEAPHWWLFGPQGEEFFAFAKRCQDDGRLWEKLDTSWLSATAQSALQLRQGLSDADKYEVDDLMGETRRTGAIARALHRASEMFYGYRTSDYDPGRFVTSEELPYCHGPSLYGVESYSREKVGAVDNAIRWLILRDVVSPELYSLVAKPWLATMGWPLHSEDAF